MSIQGGPDIVENGLILCYDPANIESYVSGSTTMYDLGSTGNTASLVGGVEYTGSFKGIFNFDGMNDYINIARPASISTSGSFSVCMFAKWRTLGTTTSSIQTLLDNNHNSSPVQGFVIQDRPELSKKLSFSVRPDQVGATSSFYVGNNNWYHIAGTHDGTVTRLYINGILDGVVSQSGGISTVQPNITLGRWQGSNGSRHLRGNIGQTLIYNRSLSLLEVQQNYNAVKGRYPSIAYTPDPYFENVTLLLRGDGIDGAQNNTFIDSSTNEFAITRNGNTTQGTFSPYGDNWSNYFDGTGDDLSLTGQNLSATDWTIECWVYFQSFSNNAPHISNFGTDINNRYTLWRNNTTGTFSFARVNGGSYDIKNGTTVPVAGRWYHIAVVRVNSTGVHTLYVDGVSEVTNTGAISSGTTWTLGFVPNGTAADRMLGYISNFRVVTSAIYTANFTPPTAPLTAITNTSLLTCHSNRFRDASSNNRTITRNGDVSVQRFSPFSPTAAYAAGTIGGSGYFDGNGDWLEIASNAALQPSSSDFGMEFWLYLESLPASSVVRPLTKSAGTYPTGFEYAFYVSSTGQLNFQAYTTSLISLTSAASTIVAKCWYHIAIARSGNNYGLFANGSRLVNQTVSGTIQSTSSAVAIGRILETGATQYITGYVCDVRIVKGSSVYDPTQTTLTVPTAPLTAITNTQLLCNFQNAAIIDSAMMNNLETVAEAQVENFVKKFGTGALEFDGNGDYLNFRVINQLPLNADFTVELWFYSRSSATQRLFSLYASGTGASYYAGVRIDLNGGPGAFGLWSSDGGNHNIGTYQGSWSLNTWTHLAITRSGNTFRFFKDGTQFYTVDSSHGIMTGTSHTIGMLAGYGGDYFNGFIDDFRVTRGVARYTSNFTPPAITLPDL